ncbi:polyphosphate polymerase domain-containing protein [Bacteroidota bacterium]
MADDSRNILKAISKFPTVTLEEMDKVRLMNRIDTKYIFPANHVITLLENASDNYRVLSINDQQIFRYKSLYFDTPVHKTYFDHHNGIRPRYKVRFREYEDTGSIFLEVKRKLTTERTRKSRIKAEGIEHELSEKSKAFIAEGSPLDPGDLSPSLWTIFRRITLVGKGKPERITIDIDLSFRHQEEEKTLPFLGICEVKRDQSGGMTEFMRILKSQKIYPGSSSKYCLGSILLNDPIKYNRFKPYILKIKKIENVYRPYTAAS